MPEWLSVIILGVVEGITEFLPISSTGHMLLVEHFLPHKQSELFLAVVQCGAVLAVLTVFAARVKDLLRNWSQPQNLDYLLKLAVAFAITVAGGLVLKKLGFKLPKEVAPIAIATLIGGVLILFVEWVMRGKQLVNEIHWLIAIAIGVSQLLAVVFPGSSRSGTTILMALTMGLARPAAAEFSFLLGIPTLLAAGAFEVFQELQHPNPIAPVHWDMLLLGTVVAAIVAFIVVKWMMSYIRTHTFAAFGWYRIVAGALILLLVR